MMSFNNDNVLGNVVELDRVISVAHQAFRVSSYVRATHKTSKQADMNAMNKLTG